jgi:hypothetical protein
LFRLFFGVVSLLSVLIAVILQSSKTRTLKIRWQYARKDE